MSRVPVTLDVDRYICSELEDLRKMYETRDFAHMLASIERIQRHANAMEEALHSNKYKEFYHALTYRYENLESLEDLKKLIKDQEDVIKERK